MSMYVVIADRGRARLFRRRARATTLDEFETLVSPPARMAVHELVADRPGRVFPRSTRALGSRGMAPRAADSESDPRVVESQRFARRIARRLDTVRRGGDLDSLIIVSPPRFLGTLREALSKPTRKIVELEIKGDWVRLTLGDILNRIRRERGVPIGARRGRA